MKMKKVLILSFSFFFIFLTFASSKTFAQAKTQQDCFDLYKVNGDAKQLDSCLKTVGTPNQTGNNPNMTGTSSGGVRPGDTAITVRIKNPLGETDTIPEAIKKIMDIVLQFVFPFIVLLFIYAGFLFVTARGNKTQIENAKRMFWYTLIGTLLILGAWTIATAIVNTVNEITG